MKKYTTIIWDWNGTLLNDVNANIKSINKVLTENGLELLTRESYRKIFGFPVKDFYVKMGFDFTKHDWDVVAHDYMNNFISEMPYTRLFEDVEPTLRFYKEKGVNHYILSAMEYNQLLIDVERQGVNQYFDAVYGINNIYAGSKVELGKKLLQENNIDISSTIMIGDTQHDYEVAQSMGIDCVLCAKGHQERARLESTGCELVIDGLSDLPKIL